MEKGLEVNLIRKRKDEKGVLKLTLSKKKRKRVPELTLFGKEEMERGLEANLFEKRKDEKGVPKLTLSKGERKMVPKLTLSEREEMEKNPEVNLIDLRYNYAMKEDMEKMKS